MQPLAWQRIVDLALLFLLLAGCTGIPAPIAEPSPTGGSIASLPASTSTQGAAPAVTYSRTEHATATQTAVPHPTATASRTAFPQITHPAATATFSDTPTLTPTPEAQAAAPAAGLRFLGPLLVDSQRGRIFTPAGRISGKPEWTAVLSTQDVRLLATYPITGAMALDAENGRLYLDQGHQGLAVLDAKEGTVLRRLTLPPVPAGSANPPAPQADPSTGQLYVIRGPAALVLDGATGEVQETISFDVRPEDNCRSPHDVALPITGSRYDAGRRILYLGFVTYVCTPWIGFSIVAYDMNTRTELGRQTTFPFTTAVNDGSLYVMGWHRFGIGTLSAWHDGKLLPRFGSTDWSGGPSYEIIVDPRRGWLYQTMGGAGADAEIPQDLIYGGTGNSLRVFETASLRLIMEIPLPHPGQLGGFDPVSGHLYFLADGRIWMMPTGEFALPAPAFGPPSAPPRRPVSGLAVPATWTQDRRLFAVWGAQQLSGRCYVFSQSGGLLFSGSPGEQAWTPLQTGMPPDCPYVSALAVSPDYEQDQTLFAGIPGSGLFKSMDAGKLWYPSSGGLPSMGIQQILVSPGFADDKTVFAVVRTGGLQRSTDGGDIWQPAGIEPGNASLSAEFDRDRTLIAFGRRTGSYDEPATLHISRDAGEHWQRLQSPGEQPVIMVSLAPEFDRWGVLFAFSGGTLYRSSDGGQTWQPVLASALADATGGQIVYGSDEAQRAVFFLATGTAFGNDQPTITGKLYRSRDGGQTWTEVILPGAAVPSSLAILPGSVRDGQIIAGTAEGQLLELDGLALPAK